MLVAISSLVTESGTSSKRYASVKAVGSYTPRFQMRVSSPSTVTRPRPLLPPTTITLMKSTLAAAGRHVSLIASRGRR